MGEGAATIILETEEHALARGAKIYAELAGGGDDERLVPHHRSRPRGLGRLARGARGARAGRCDAGRRHPHQRARDDARRSATSPSTTRCVAVFGDRAREIPVSATKASTGHLLGGTGALEAIFTILAIHEKTAPPTINLTEQDPEIPLDVVTSPRALEGPQLAISNSFGFGGHNSVVAFRTY